MAQRTTRPVATVLLALAACSAPADWGTERRAEPITHGTVDEGDLGVVGLVDNGVIYCTGTMVSSRVAVTAGHCVGSMGPEAVVFGSSIAEGLLVAVIDARAAAGFDLRDLSDDIGAVLLGAPAPEMAEIWPPWQEPFDDALIGRPIRIVGFGETENPDDLAGIKREGQSEIASFTETTFRFTASPSQTCLGDSGGPAFLSEGGVEYLVGVTSSGDPGCVEFADDTRVDAFVAELIQPYIAATGEGAAAEGERCFYPENCAEGACREPVESLAFSYCASSCQDSDDCPDGMTCIQDTDASMVCRHAGPEPGAMGASCADRLDCATGMCVPIEGDGRSLCTLGCLSESDQETCPAGYECRANPVGPSEFACFEEPDGCSCRAAGAQSRRDAPGLPALLSLLLLAAARRPR